jgi:hypothetical protein
MKIVPVEQQFANPDTVWQRPQRGPIEVPKVLIPYYKNKRVVEIGFGVGDFIPTWAEHATSVIAYEREPELFEIASHRKDLQALTNVSLVEGSIEFDELPDADFYYIWTHMREIREWFELFADSKKPGTFAAFCAASELAVVENIADTATAFLASEPTPQPEFHDLSVPLYVITITNKATE